MDQTLEYIKKKKSLAYSLSFVQKMKKGFEDSSYLWKMCLGDVKVGDWDKKCDISSKGWSGEIVFLII